MKNKVGIVGGGQLGRMLAFEAKKLGFHVTVIDPTPQSSAGQVVDGEITAGYSDAAATKKLASMVDFMTVEIEHINTDTLQDLVDNSSVQIHPSPQTIAMIKDKYNQKQFLKKNHIPTADFQAVTSQSDIIKAAKLFGYPLVLKARHDAYDGRGNILIKNKQNIKPSLEKLVGRKLYVEKLVRFKKELAIMIARSTKGEIVPYDVVETIHKNNICHIVKAPAAVSDKIRQQAKELAVSVMEHLKGAGVFGIEMFYCPSYPSEALAKEGFHHDELLINEIAPRVHNSGHYTIETCVTNQFEQHVRAVTGLPLGNPEMLVNSAVMINILGDRFGPAKLENLGKVLQMKNVHVHIYGKKDTKPERKMGHITVIDTTIQKALKKALLARNYITI